MEVLANTIKLMAKTGLFFANVDGEYADSEREYIENFVSGIEKVGAIEDELKAEIQDSLKHTYTLDQVVADTKAVIADFNDDEKQNILVSLNGFVDKVINADGKVQDAESKAYAEWKSALGIN